MSIAFEIPPNCKHVKIDIGLSYTAPISNKWLIKEPDVFVLGVEPNPHCCDMIMSSNFEKTTFLDFNLEKKFIEQGRFQLLQCALSDVDGLVVQPFFINQHDYGTSSLYTHDQQTLGPIERVVNVNVINLKMIFENFPWDRFEYIDYIKIDAQGSDLDILQSAGYYLKDKVVYITAEPESYSYENCSHNNEKNIEEYLLSQNFIRVFNKNTSDPTYINKKFQHLENEIYIFQN